MRWVRNIARLQALSASSKHRDAFEIMPQTFVLPHEYTKFVAAFYAQAARLEGSGQPNLWILKPVGLSRGRGISLVSDLSAVKYDMQTVVQACEYLLGSRGTLVVWLGCSCC